MVEAARNMQEAGVAIGTTAPRVPQASISSFEGVVPKSVNWRTLGGGSERPQERVA
jgi:phthalate 4,5-dioxygenase oxygenase subunit